MDKSITFMISSLFQQKYLTIIFVWIAGSLCLNAQVRTIQSGNLTFKVPEEYLKESENIPPFWITSLEDIADYLFRTVKKGQVEIIGTTAGGRPMRAVVYGRARQGKGTSTFSGALGYGNVKAYRGPDHEMTVYWGIAGIHAFEYEGIVGVVNLVSILETGKDLRGKAWPEITEIAAKIDRIVLIPVTNPDGRARIPLRMALHRGTDNTVGQYLNTGGYPDGTLIGYPQVKEFVPIDLGRSVYPGGYTNDAGVNLVHDDFFGDKQPETKALFDLAARERPDLIINMHTGATYINLYRPVCEAVMSPVFDSLYVTVHRRLTIENLQGTKDLSRIRPERVDGFPFNLDAALNMHCGALSVCVESPGHSAFAKTSSGEIITHTPDRLLDAQLFVHQESMRFLAESGGRAKWTRSK